MDSGNSGSLQSSSGGDDEYDSRAAAAADSISAFMNNPISNNQPPPQQPPPPPFFDPFSNYLNPNMAWPGNTLRSDPNPIPPFMPSFQTTASFGVDNNNNNNHPSVTTATTPHNQNQTTAAARNPKKRSRASRRAPTTVLTTDTNNFRAMVQEFTGIPAPPFNNSPFTRTRFDLFTGGIGSTTTNTLDAPPYLRRPFAQKVQSPLPFFTSTNSGNSNYHQLQIPQNSNVFNNIQNPILTSLLQTNPKFTYPSNSTIMASKSHNQNSFQIPTNEFSLSNDQDHASTSINGLQTLISSDHQIAMRSVPSDNDPVNRDENNHDNDDDRVNITMNGVQMNYSASSNFNGEKLTENITATKGEGMVESWICSSSE
ncbi:hypothetical protein BUALT_Bualt04G0020800 [Buddleja alternifolia]|uniref:VQ domain-containing protein n=1 Tax=Buddleja alternifolia TaxID=168488 RepID=A0AAV6XT68_9LAMI|nr:hypothetical protein BUALT_Bualt04G0020800 [Buddleja alternifolia]